MKKFVIDVSTWQGRINWEKVKPHIDGAILRCGFGMDLEKQDDNCFHYNAAECTRLGIPFGVYLYSYADSEEKAKSEAAHVLRLIKPYSLSYPVYLDLEEYKTRKGAVERAVTFCEIIKAAGYLPGIYANLNWWGNYLTSAKLDGYTKWVAQYYKKCQYHKPYDMWQYSSSGKVPGIAGRVDVNECYRDFPGELGTGKRDPAQKPQEEKSVEVLAREVIDGKWGNGIARCQKLTEAGYDYAAVQKKVNEMLAAKSAICVGSSVKLKPGARTYDGKGLAAFVYGRKYRVKEIAGDRVVITFAGVIVAAVKAEDLEVA